MAVIYHDPSSKIPKSWVKVVAFQPVDVNQENKSWNEQVDQGTPYRLTSKYEEHYGFFVRIGRIVFGSLLSLTVVSLAFRPGRKFIGDLLFNSVQSIHIIRKVKNVSQKKLAEIRVSMAGNPAHMGHMHMIALAIWRLMQEGYKIKKVQISLSSEEYLKNKVHWCNVSIEKNKHEAQESEMFKVFIPREQRIAFLRAAIRQAKDDKVFDEALNIDYCDDQDDHSSGLSRRKIFHVCGTDYAEDEGAFRNIKHAVIITRDGKMPEGIFETHTEDCSRLIVDNTSQTNIYSSSKIQNGAYEQLPESVREEFRRLHQEAQPKAKQPNFAAQDDELKSIRNPIARETAIAIRQGFYISPSGIKFPLRTGAQLLAGSLAIPNSILISPLKQKYDDLTITVIDQDCLKAAEVELRNGAEKVAVLMFASPTEPGGGMEDFNNGQEEDLCRRSDIFGFMRDQAYFTAEQILYNLVDLNVAHEVDPSFSSMTNNRMIHVPQVTVFRSGKNDGHKMLEEPFEVGMLVSPALDRPRFENANGKMHYIREEDQEQLWKLIMTQLKVAYDENYDTVILGAFGCGAFYNPPELIAECYKEIITTYFRGAFKKIVFAILDDHPGDHNPEGNLKPFVEIFH